jgi:hypothetical protein
MAKNGERPGAGREPVLPPEALLALMGKVEADGLELLGQGGVLAELPKVVIERALEEERTLGEGAIRWSRRSRPGSGGWCGPVSRRERVGTSRRRPA